MCPESPHPSQHRNTASPDSNNPAACVLMRVVCVPDLPANTPIYKQHEKNRLINVSTIMMLSRTISSNAILCLLLLLTDNNLHVTERNLAGTPDQDSCLSSARFSTDASRSS